MKCSRCPIKTECNRIMLRAKDREGNVKKVCPLLWIIGLHLKEVSRVESTQRASG